MNRTIFAKAAVAVAILLTTAVTASRGSAADSFACTPTEWDEIGPFYRPNAPLRSRIGTGYVLIGTVRSAKDCAPIANARIELWQVGPTGEYDDNHRATIYSDRQGRYSLSTSFPPAYGRRRPHIHIVVDARGYDGVITQHYPVKRTKQGKFDLVLVPESADSGKGRDPLGRR